MHDTVFYNTAWTLVAQGGRMVLQSAYFIFLGRLLGPEGYGLLAGALAFVFILAPFAGWGSGSVLIMQVARDSSTFSAHWGKSLCTIGVSGTLFALVAWMLGPVFLPSVPKSLILVLAVSEFYFGKVTETAAQAFQAFERLKITAYLNLLLALGRLGAVVLFESSFPRTPESWGLFYLCSTGIVSVVSFVLVSRMLGLPKIEAPRMADLTYGFHFALGLASSTVYNDIDKAMLTRLGTAEAAGIYAAAYRAVGLAFAPISSLLRATYALFFRQGAKGLRSGLEVAARFLPMSALYGLLASAGLFFFAPWTPRILGTAFEPAADALRLLSPLPIIQGLQYFAGDILIGSGYVRIRSLMQLATAILNIGANLFLIPTLSWKGAVWASVAANIILAIGLWTAILIIELRSRAWRGAQ